jgi:hypothetical protein
MPSTTRTNTSTNLLVPQLIATQANASGCESVRTQNCSTSGFAPANPLNLVELMILLQYHNE